VSVSGWVPWLYPDREGANGKVIKEIIRFKVRLKVGPKARIKTKIKAKFKFKVFALF
jgi:hypothetical protein